MILFFGPPGSGKSVQGELLVERCDLRWLSTGKLFRESKDPAVLARLATGELISDELTNQVLATALNEVADMRRIVLDGYPRTAAQANWLIKELAARNHALACVVVFDVPKEELIRRLTGRGRIEDDVAVVEHRLQIYHDKTKPVLDVLTNNNIAIHHIDGGDSIEAVHEAIQAIVTPCLPK